MDDPALDEMRHIEALQGLERLNFFSGSARVVWTAIADLLQGQAPAAGSAQSCPCPGAAGLRILDIATGGGDMPIRLWHKARRAGLDPAIDACDLSLQALKYASQRAEEAGARVRFFQLDALSDAIPPGYDVVVSSLFFHHLDQHDAVRLLGKMAFAARRMVVVNDLERSRTNLLLTTIATRLLSRSGVVHHDGPASVRAAYTIEEIKAIAKGAGLAEIAVRACWPCRFLLTGRGLS